MPSYLTAFPSKFLKAEDLGARPVVGTIHRADLEDVGASGSKERKLVAHFEELALKPLVLNRINCATITEIAGTDDYGHWSGVRVQLFASKTEFQGKRVPCIRIVAPLVPNPTPAAAPPPAPQAAQTPSYTDDDIDAAFPVTDGR